jgi:hypothetical protein
MKNVSATTWLMKRGHEICSGAQVVLKRGARNFPEAPCLGQEIIKKFWLFSFLTFFLLLLPTSTGKEIERMLDEGG